MSRRVVITGIGAVTPVGNDATATWSGLVAGRSGVGPITTFDASTFPVRIAGQVKGFDLAGVVPDARLRRHLSRAGSFGLAAAAEAVSAAGAGRGTYPPEACGVSVGGSAGRPPLEEMADVFHTMQDGRSLRRQAPSAVLERDQQTGAAAIARLAGCEGPVLGVATACTASGHAVGEAFRLVQDGDATLMVTGGYDSLLSWLDVLGFALLGALTTEYADQPERASRPFSDDRAGFVIGEGAVMVVLEEREAALARGAPVLAELVGYASTMNAYRMTDPPPDGGGVTLAMAQALDDAGMAPDAIDYIAAHGTSTPGNDVCETNAIKEVFGAHAYDLAVSSCKSMTGHLTAAAAGLGLLCAVGALREQVVPPTINLDHPDPKLDLDYVPHVAKPMTVRATMVNAFAFGGTNSCLVVQAP